MYSICDNVKIHYYSCTISVACSVILQSTLVFKKLSNFVINILLRCISALSNFVNKWHMYLNNGWLVWKYIIIVQRLLNNQRNNILLMEWLLIKKISSRFHFHPIPTPTSLFCLYLHTGFGIMLLWLSQGACMWEKK